MKATVNFTFSVWKNSACCCCGGSFPLKSSWFFFFSWTQWSQSPWVHFNIDQKIAGNVKNPALQWRWSIFNEQQGTADYLMWSNLAFYTVLYGSFVGSQLCRFRHADGEKHKHEGPHQDEYQHHVDHLIFSTLCLQSIIQSRLWQDERAREMIFDAVNLSQSER